MQKKTVPIVAWIDGMEQEFSSRQNHMISFETKLGLNQETHHLVGHDDIKSQESSNKTTTNEALTIKIIWNQPMHVFNQYSSKKSYALYNELYQNSKRISTVKTNDELNMHNPGKCRQI